MGDCSFTPVQKTQLLVDSKGKLWIEPRVGGTFVYNKKTYIARLRQNYLQGCSKCSLRCNPICASISCGPNRVYFEQIK